MAETTTAAPVMSAVAELVLIAMRENLPAPKYTTVSDGEAYKQICLTLNNRAELDAWNAAFGNVHVTECKPTAEERDVLVSTMHGGSLLGWSLNLLAHVPLPLSPEVLAALGEAARADAATLVAEAVAVLDEPKASPVPDGHCWCGNVLADGACPRPNCPPFDIATGKPAELPAAEVWDGSVPPGGFVCSVCRTPVESEPCELHGAVES